MGASRSHVIENVSPRVVPVLDGHRQACLWQPSAYGPGEASCRVVLATLNANTHLAKMILARGRKMKAFAELRAMLEVDPTGLGRRVEALQRWTAFEAEVPRVNSWPELAVGCGIPSVVKESIELF